MAFTKVVGPGIHTLAQLRTHNIHSAGIITATKFVGEMESGGGDSTFQNVTVNGNLTVQGDTTTLNTTLRNVELLRVAANSTTTAGIITQTGTGDILNLFDGSTEVLTVVDGGRVGIGLTNPQSNTNLHIKAATINQLRLETTDNASYGIIRFVEGDHDGVKDKYIIGYNDSHSAQADQLSIKNQIGDITFMAGGVATSDEKVRIKSDGKVGIGITNPAMKLHLNEDSSSASYMIFTNSTSGVTNNDGLIIGLDSNEGANFWLNELDYMKFGTDDTERLRIDSSGNVHLGDWDSQGTVYGKARLNIRGADEIATSFNLANSYLHIGGQESTLHGLYPISFGHTKAASTKASSYIGAKVTDAGSYEKTALVFATRDVTTDSAPEERLRIDSSGRVGINTTNLEGNMVYLNHNGTNSPTTAVTIGGKGIVARGGTGIFLKSSSSTSDNRYGTRIHSIREESNNGASSLVISNEKSDASALAEVLRITSAARVGIGITNPVRLLHLHESNGNEAMIHFSTSATGVAVGDGFRVGMNGSEEAIVWNNENGIIKFGTGNGERARITGIGSFGIHEDNPITKVHIGVVGKEIVTYGGGQHDTACVRIQDKGSNNGYYHGLELRTKRSGDVRLYAHDAGADAAHFVIATDNSGIHERFRITNEGKVGINTTNPNALLEFGVARSLQSYPPIKFKGRWGNGLADAAISTTDDTGGVDLMIGANLYMGSNGTLTRYYDSYGSSAVRVGYGGVTRFYNKSGNNDPVESMRIDGDGQVGINTTTCSKTLTIYGHSSSTFRISKSGVLAYDHIFDGSTYEIKNNNGSAGIPLSIGTKTSGAESVYIDASGRVKIGAISDHTAGATQCPVYIRMTTDLTAHNTAEGAANNGLLRIEETGTNPSRFHGIELRNRQSGDIRFLNKDVDTSDRGDLVLVMPSAAAPSSKGVHQKMRFNSIHDSIHIAGKGGAVIANSATERTDIYISTVTGLTSFNTQAGDEVAGLIRFEDKGTTDNRYHGIELRNRNSGDARILVKSNGVDNECELCLGIDNAGPIETLRLDKFGGISHRDRKGATNITAIHNGNGSGSWYTGTPQRIYPQYWDKETGYGVFYFFFNPSTSYSGYENPKFVIRGGTGFTNVGGGSMTLSMNQRTNSPANGTFRHYHLNGHYQIYNDGDTDQVSGQREFTKDQETYSAHFGASSCSIDYIPTNDSRFGDNEEPHLDQYSYVKVQINDGSASNPCQGHRFFCKFETWTGAEKNWHAYMVYNG